MIDGSKFNDSLGNIVNAGTEVLFGSVIPWDRVALSSGQEYKRNIIAAKPLLSMPAQLYSGAEDKAFMSWDGLIRPVSLDGCGEFSQFASSQAGASYRGFSNGAQPPIYPSGSSSTLEYDLKIDNTYLNPLSNTASQSNWNELQGRHTGSAGHDIDIVSRSGYIPESGYESACLPMDEITSGEENDPYAEDYMFVGLRGPCVVQGWGYDLDGKPVPNKADTEANAAQGTFVNTDLEDAFMADWLRKSNTWPTGPIDLRWDRKRACWVAPQTHRLVVATLAEDLLPNDSASGYMTSGPQLYNSAGDEIPYGDSVEDSPHFKAYDMLEEYLPSGTNIISYFDPQREKYYPIANNKKQLYIFETTGDIYYGAESFGAVLIDCSGGIYSNSDNEITVYTGRTIGADIKLPVNDMWGPCTSGMQGWCRINDECGRYEVVYMERFAQYLEYTDILSVASSQFTISSSERVKSWYGTDPFDAKKPPSSIVGNLGGWQSDGCVPNPYKGIVVFDAKSSTPSTLQYDVIEDNDGLVAVDSTNYVLQDDLQGIKAGNNITLTAVTVDGCDRFIQIAAITGGGTVGGSGINVADSGCGDTSIGGWSVATDIMFGTGISVADDGGNQATVSLDLGFQDTEDSFCDSPGDYSKQTERSIVETLNFGYGLGFLQSGDDCVGVVQLEMPISTASLCYSGNVNVDIDAVDSVSSLIFEEGLKAKYDSDNCEAEIHLAMDWGGSNQNVAKVIEGSGITFSMQNDDCTVEISSSGTIDVSSDTACYYDNGNPAIGAGDEVEELVFEEGLKVKYDAASKAAEVHLAMDWAGGGTDVAKVVAGEHITLSVEDTCTAKISAEWPTYNTGDITHPTGMTTTVGPIGTDCHEFTVTINGHNVHYELNGKGDIFESVAALTGVYCSGSNVYGEGNYMNFDACGHFVSTTGHWE